ncbi:MAG: hypothetical protein CL678_14535 [Bdellovibrionaceae bacterium]|nr:hypothetical protein [Pseudobdellovibrionaceae bacterium]
MKTVIANDTFDVALTIKNHQTQSHPDYEYRTTRTLVNMSTLGSDVPPRPWGDGWEENPHIAQSINDDGQVEKHWYRLRIGRDI